jgi:hypothetical protein
VESQNKFSRDGIRICNLPFISRTDLELFFSNKKNLKDSRAEAKKFKRQSTKNLDNSNIFENPCREQVKLCCNYIVFKTTLKRTYFAETKNN